MCVTVTWNCCYNIIEAACSREACILEPQIFAWSLPLALHSLHIFWQIFSQPLFRPGTWWRSFCWPLRRCIFICYFILSFNWAYTSAFQVQVNTCSVEYQCRVSTRWVSMKGINPRPIRYGYIGQFSTSEWQPSQMKKNSCMESQSLPQSFWITTPGVRVIKWLWKLHIFCILGSWPS